MAELQKRYRFSYQSAIWKCSVCGIQNLSGSSTCQICDKSPDVAILNASPPVPSPFNSAKSLQRQMEARVQAKRQMEPSDEPIRSRSTASKPNPSSSSSSSSTSSSSSSFPSSISNPRKRKLSLSSDRTDTDLHPENPLSCSQSSLSVLQPVCLASSVSSHSQQSVVSVTSDENLPEVKLWQQKAEESERKRKELETELTTMTAERDDLRNQMELIRSSLDECRTQRDSLLARLVSMKQQQANKEPLSVTNSPSVSVPSASSTSLSLAAIASDTISSVPSKSGTEPIYHTSTSLHSLSVPQSDFYQVRSLSLSLSPLRPSLPSSLPSPISNERTDTNIVNHTIPIPALEFVDDDIALPSTPTSSDHILIPTPTSQPELESSSSSTTPDVALVLSPTQTSPPKETPVDRAPATPEPFGGAIAVTYNEDDADAEDDEFFSDHDSDVGDVVEEILGRRAGAYGIEYFVRWEGPGEECEWVRQSDMDGCEELINTYERHRNDIPTKK